MRGTAMRSVFILTAVASALFGGVAGYALRAVGSAPLSRPGPAPGKAERAGQVATPQEALTVAFRALPALERFTQYDAYRVEITRVKDHKAWGVRILALPESPDFFEFTTVNDDGTTWFTQGR